MIPLVRFLLIVAAYLSLPFYGLWVGGGWLMDRWEQRKSRLPPAWREMSIGDRIACWAIEIVTSLILAAGVVCGMYWFWSGVEMVVR